MPIYTYRREDGTTFELRQKFLDEPLQQDPETGQKVQRVIQSAGVIFKGSGYYVTDTRGANNPAKPSNGENGTSHSSSTNNNNSNNTTPAPATPAASTTTAAAD